MYAGRGHGPCPAPSVVNRLPPSPATTGPRAAHEANHTEWHGRARHERSVAPTTGTVWGSMWWRLLPLGSSRLPFRPLFRLCRWCGRRARARYPQWRRRHMLRLHILRHCSHLPSCCVCSTSDPASLVGPHPFHLPLAWAPRIVPPLACCLASTRSRSAPLQAAPGQMRLRCCGARAWPRSSR